MIVGTEGKFVATKGAVDTILGLSSPPEEVKRLVVQTQFELSAEGLRVLAVGRAFAGKYEVIGIVGLMDPPQPGVRERLTGLRRLGVGVKMLTGDALPIARQVAGEVGLGHAVTRMSEIHQVKDEADMGRMIQAADGLAEILPEDKYLVVKSMQATGEVVGMTGDGVNDAPALRQADVGIAVAGATDIARRSAGVILEEKGLKGMLALVRVGRSVFQRVMTWILNKVAKTIEVIVFVVLSFLFSGTYSTSITGIITYLLLTDFVTLSISSDRVKPSAKPDSWRLPGVLGTGLVIGVATVAESIVLLYLLQMWFPASESQYGMYVFDILTLSALLNLVVVRERSRAWSSAPSGTLGISLILDIALVVAISTFGLADLEGVPLQATLLVLGYFALMAFAVNDTLKAIAFKRYGLARAPPLKEAQE